MERLVEYVVKASAYAEYAMSVFTFTSTFIGRTGITGSVGATGRTVSDPGRKRAGENERQE